MGTSARSLMAAWPFWLGFLSCLILFCLNITGFGLDYYPGDLGDARFNNYILEHGFQYFSGQVPEFWSAGFMYPVPEVISYSDNLLGTSPFYGAFRLFGICRERSFALWFILVSILNYTACYFFLRWLFKDRYAAAAGAFLFACSIAVQGQITHAQTFTRFPIPLMVWSVMLFLKTFRPKYFFIALVLSVYQTYCGMYLGVMLVVPLLLLLVFSVPLYWKEYLASAKQPGWWLQMIGSAVVAVVLMLPLMRPYHDRAKETGYYTYEAVLNSVPEPVSRIFTPEGSLIWKVFEDTNMDHPGWWEDQIFPGGAALLSLLVFVVVVFSGRFRRMQTFNGLGRPLLLLAVTAVASILMFIKFGRFSLYYLPYHFLPGFGSIRVVPRFMNIELLFYAVAAAFMYLLIKRKTRHSAALFLAFMTVLNIDNFRSGVKAIRISVTESQARVAKITDQFNRRDPAQILAFEPVERPYNIFVYQIDAMLAAQELGVRTINGYSGNCPPGFHEYWGNPDSTSRTRWITAHNVPTSAIQVVR